MCDSVLYKKVDANLSPWMKYLDVSRNLNRIILKNLSYALAHSITTVN